MANTVIRWNPFRELASMQSAMDRMFNEAWEGSRYNFAGGNLLIDAYETDNAYTFVASVPGVSPEHININVHEGVLNIEVNVPEPEVDDKTRVLMQERFFGTLTRQFTIPKSINSDAVEASYDSGVLTLTLPKSPEAQPRTIPVRTPNLLSQN